MQSGALSRAILLHPSLKESVTSISFSTSEELLWSGTATGCLFALQCPDLSIYSTVRAHKVPILGSSPLGDGVTSVSQEWVRWHSSGGVPRAMLTVAQAEVEAFTAICTEPHSRGQAMVGYSCAAAAGADSPAENGVALVDLFTGKVVSKAAVAEPVYVMRPAARGLIALGSPGGAVALADPRAGFKVQHSVAAHAAGLADMDARADSLATCGYGTRQGMVVAENYVKVYDLRSAPRMTASVPFPAGPSLLRFHPKFSSTILIASSLGSFTLADTSGAAFSRYERLETEGDTITACDVSASGEEIAFGSAAGYLYLWVMGSPTEAPRVNAYSQPLEVPSRVPPPPASPLTEDDSFALAAVYPAGQGRLLSDMSAAELALTHRPPRLVHPLVAAGLKQVDFVGHAQNPHLKRGMPRGEAARAAAPLRNLRLEAKPERLELVDGRVERERKRAAAGQSGLPEGYRYITLRQVHSSRFDDFDYALHNPTRFAGLENEIANCYANSLLQVLYFIPELRAAMLAVRPDPGEEFSLADEVTLLIRMLQNLLVEDSVLVTLLFRMLLAGGPAACQATNLLRALRQNKGAAALGLLETHSQRSGENTDIEVETNKEKSLPRRVQSLQRFLLERLKSELAQRRLPPPLPALPEADAPNDDQPSSSSHPAGAAEPGVSANSAPDQSPGSAAEDSSGDNGMSREGNAAVGEVGEGVEGEQWPPAPAQLAAGLDCLFGILMQQRIRCLYGEKAEKTQDILSFQVELQYPPAKERPTRAAGAADAPQPLSFRPGEAPKAAALPQWAPDQVRPSFSELLAASLKPAADMRAWFDDRLKYQHVQQQRLPKRLPTVLVVSCGLLDSADLLWWQPYHSHPHRRSCAWLPAAIEVTSDYSTSQVTVREADNAADLATPAEDAPEEATPPEQATAPREGTPPDGISGRTRAVYELAALVAHILEDTGVKEKNKGKKERVEDEGHIVAHIKVLPPYVQPGQGFMPDAREASSPGASPLPTGFGRRPRSAPASSRLGSPGAKLGTSDYPPPSASPSGMDPGPKAEPGRPLEGSGYSPGSESNTCTADVEPDVFTVQDDPQATAADGPSAGLLPTGSAEGVLDQALQTGSAPSAVADMGECASMAATDGTAPEDAMTASGRAADVEDVLELSAEVERLACAGGNAGEGDGGPGPEGPGTAPDDGAQTLELDRGSEPAALAAARSGSLPATSQPSAQHEPAPPVNQSQGHAIGEPDLPKGPSPISLGRGIAPGRRAEWLLFNDFSITPTNAAEVTQLYGLQKVPCLLYYKQVDSIEAAAQMPPPKQGPVLSFEAFRQLCNAPPLQFQGASRLKPPTFQALGPDEEVRPGMLLGIDTEFVAHSPPDKVMRGGVEVETRPSRLGLGRVSVVRGTGALSGQACIDDYIRATEPIFDYLTKWSGLVPGDLDPALSPHHLTTHKAAYLKLRFLVDAGAIFVGHGLKKDFRMLNIVVPPAQVVDTVELFHFKRQRKLSLRFLAGYLLGAVIQKDTHDSIVDARTALSLFEVYKRLNAEGKFQEKLLEMYRWGKANGWDAAPAQQGPKP
ncbi:probable PAN2-PAN3 deadenylation complex catalytic subunit pan2 [Coccomyxa sp. Obi]|nr:probable PAN2-PAN3 deadenylation complex catalytic subunit pan2 [Coccomyxa sp. Obi]